MEAILAGLSGLGSWLLGSGGAGAAGAGAGAAGAGAAGATGAGALGAGAAGAGAAGAGAAGGGGTSLLSALSGGLSSAFPGATSAGSASGIGSLGAIPELGVGEGVVLTQTPNLLGGLGATGQLVPGATSAVELGGEAAQLAAPLGQGLFSGTTEGIINSALSTIGQNQGLIRSGLGLATKKPQPSPVAEVAPRRPTIPLTSPEEQQRLLRALMFGGARG